MRVRATIALATLALGLVGCASDIRTPVTLVAKITRVTTVIVMTGDVAGEWPSYTLQPVEPAGEAFQATALKECPGFNRDQIYRVRIERKTVVYGLTDRTDRKTVTDLIVTACEAVKGI